MIFVRGIIERKKNIYISLISLQVQCALCSFHLSIIEAQWLKASGKILRLHISYARICQEL